MQFTSTAVQTLSAPASTVLAVGSYVLYTSCASHRMFNTQSSQSRPCQLPRSLQAKERTKRLQSISTHFTLQHTTVAAKQRALAMFGLTVLRYEPGTYFEVCLTNDLHLHVLRRQGWPTRRLALLLAHVAPFPNAANASPQGYGTSIHRFGITYHD